MFQYIVVVFFVLVVYVQTKDFMTDKELELFYLREANDDCGDCENGGICKDKKCICPAPFSKERCYYFDCANGGQMVMEKTCRNKCKCADGFGSVLCRQCTSDKGCKNGKKCITDLDTLRAKNATTHFNCEVKPPYGLLLGQNVTTHCEGSMCYLEAWHNYYVEDEKCSFIAELFSCVFEDCKYSKSEQGIVYSCAKSKCLPNNCGTQTRAILKQIKNQSDIKCDKNFVDCELSPHDVFFSFGLTCSVRGCA